MTKYHRHSTYMLAWVYNIASTLYLHNDTYNYTHTYVHVHIHTDSFI